MEIEEKMAEKPKDWPMNAREMALEAVCEKVEEFRKNPSYKTREVLLSLVCNHDLNQSTGIGLMRVTEYEVATINYLYMIGAAHQINLLKVYLYDLITETTRLQKIMSWCNPVLGVNDEEAARIITYEKGLMLPLKLYHFAYQKYTIEKEFSFAEQLISVVNGVLQVSTTEDEVDSITYAYSALLHDISNMHGNKKERIWEFTREELLELFNLEAKILKINNKSPIKYLPKNVAKESVTNHQIWMKKTELLNDKREQKVIPELFQDTSWVKYDWIKDIDFTATRTYYVSCFSKAINSNEMQKDYGQCLYGYKNDRIVDLIAPIGIMKLKKRNNANDDLPDTIERPYISQVIAFDVLYDETEAKKELEYLFDVINMFAMSDSEKKQFLQEILQYWILSVKDYEWQEEKERRYVIFLYEDYDYKEVEVDDTFLKIKHLCF